MPNLNSILTLVALTLSAPCCYAFSRSLNLSGGNSLSARTRTSSFVPSNSKAIHNPNNNYFGGRIHRSQSSQPLHMALDLVTYLRTEWIATSLCSNQTPREAKVVLQIGSEDGRAVTMIPRSVETLITSSAEADGVIPVTAERQLRQQAERRGAARVRIVNQHADNLKETKDESVDVVISMQAAERMYENGLDWTNSVKEAARVLKPGGRFLFVEKTQINEIDYIDCVMGTYSFDQNEEKDDSDKSDEEVQPKRRLFEMVGYDDVDMVLVPHIAGVVIKSSEGGMTDLEVEARKTDDEKDRLAELSISAFERGIKKRRKKKKVQDEEEV
uniref:Methyltransferase type 11 domain-containing protein n=1 Tax=Eucampia antarctica TaxID=49252 RepID=A0A7S2R9C8_9STRA|mmetsp:Transcript_191/g.197  ORF Transcript_191/g.197 Transcript_191/m.197 type:complete len:329 (+) Transcript_191:70-1056(+)